LVKFRDRSQAVLAISSLAEKTAQKKDLALTNIEPRLQAQKANETALGGPNGV